jgi:hypothetical protein
MLERQHATTLSSSVEDLLSIVEPFSQTALGFNATMPDAFTPPPADDLDEVSPPLSPFNLHSSVQRRPSMTRGYSGRMLEGGAVVSLSLSLSLSLFSSLFSSALLSISLSFSLWMLTDPTC